MWHADVDGMLGSGLANVNMAVVDFSVDLLNVDLVKGSMGQLSAGPQVSQRLSSIGGAHVLG